MLSTVEVDSVMKLQLKVQDSLCEVIYKYHKLTDVNFICYFKTPY